MPPDQLPPCLLCHPARLIVFRGWQGVCPECGSFWDLRAYSREYLYDEQYPQQRGHFDPRVGSLKVETLRRWLDQLGLLPEQYVVCEVGFGGGYCLQYLHQTARTAFGIETIPQNLAHAAALGVPAERLYNYDRRPVALPAAVSFWVFQDSFEHIPAHRPFLKWMAQNSSADSMAFIVAPDARSLSRLLLRRLWPHRSLDHTFHWSKAGLRALLSEFGFSLVRQIRPTKAISKRMVISHAELACGPACARLLASVLPEFTTWFNLGELGLLFQRRSA